MFRICTLKVRVICCEGKIEDGTEWTLKEMESKAEADAFFSRCTHKVKDDLQLSRFVG